MPIPAKLKFNGTKLRQLRRAHFITKKGMTAEDLAKAIGRNRTAIMRWERGETSPGSTDALAISQYFGIPVEDLFYDPEAEPSANKLKKKTKKETKSS